MITIRIEESNTWGKDISAMVSFPFNTEILAIVKSMPRKQWHNDNKTWEIPFTSLGDLLGQLNKFEVEIKADNTEIFKQMEKEQNLDFDFKTAPFQHQIEGFKYGISHNRWLLGDEQGLGKTKQVIDIAVARKQQRGYKHCLIICGVNGLKWNWVA